MGETKTTYIMPDQNSFGNNDLATMALLNGNAMVARSLFPKQFWSGIM